MKKRNLVKSFAITLCLSFFISTLAFAKDNKEYKQYKSSRAVNCAVVPHPGETEFPE